MNFQMFKLDLEKAEEPEINCQYLSDHQKSKSVPEKHLLLLIDNVKAFDCVDHNELESSSRNGNTRPPTCLLRKLYAGQKATVRTGPGTRDLFQIGKGRILSPCLFNLYAEYIMGNARLDESQTGIKTARKK